VHEATTLWAGIDRTPEGSYLDLREGRARTAAYWEPQFGPRLDLSRPELVAGLWQQVEEAVDIRLARGGHTAIVMSGGLDSATVAAAASRRARSDDELIGYSAVFPNHPQVDESGRLQAIAAALGLQTLQVSVEPAGVVRRALEYLDRWQTGFPGPGYVLEHDLLARAAAAGASVALDGQGGDETFSHWPWEAADLLQRGRVLASWRAVREAPGAEGRSRRAIFAAWRRAALKGALPHRLHRAARRARPAGRAPSWMTADAARQYGAASDVWRWKTLAGPRSWAFVVDMLAGAGRAGFAEYFRRRAQAFGVEARPPLLDTALIDYVLALPAAAARDLRIDRPLIREALMHLIPDAVRLSHVKSDLSPFYRDGIAADFPAVRRLLEPRSARIGAFVKREHLALLLEAPPREGDDEWLSKLTQLWNFAGLEAWLRQQEDELVVGNMLSSWTLAQPNSRIHAGPSTGLAD
jgi:asparagine synthase (glutamine-hydrolysing)